MNTRIDKTRSLRAQRGNVLTAKSWLTEAALRMLCNNLDAEVAEAPESLVVYGGIGRAARNWEAFDTIVEVLTRLEDNETLLVQSGKPVGVFTTHPDAPRVLIANSNLVPHWANWEHFNELTYLSPVLGGWIADNLIGQKRSIFVGACILLLSYVFLASATSRELLVAALAGVAVGTGLFKPNISSLLGNAYTDDSPKRESGFTIFYMGITAGIVLGTTLPSQLNAMFGWPVSFLSAAFGMLIAITVFDYGVRRYRISDYHPRPLTLQNIGKTLLLLLLLWGIAFAILNHPSLADSAFAAIVVISLMYMAVTIRKESGAQARQTFVIGLLCVISVMFWAFYFQMFLSLTLCIARIVKPTLFGLQFPPPYYVAVQSLGMIAAGVFLARRVNAPTLIERGIVAANKFVYAMLCITLAYGLIALACHVEANVLMLSPLLLIPSYLLISVAEMLLSPVGLSAITFLASRKRVSTMMGIFFVSLGLGGFLAGKLALLSAIPEGETGILAMKEHYAHSFFILFMILLGASGVSIWINRIIQRLLRGTHCE